MSQYGIDPLEFKGLKTVGLAERGGKVRRVDFATPYAAGAGVRALIESLPHILAGDSFRAVIYAMLNARAEGSPLCGRWEGTLSNAAWRRS